jgi:hypothetical protein
MSYFSELDIELQEKADYKMPKEICINSVGVCLDDYGQPVQLYIVDTIWGCGLLDVFLLNGPEDQEPREVHRDDFWCLA